MVIQRTLVLTTAFVHKDDAIKLNHYENTPIQMYRKFRLQKLKIFR